MKRTHYKQKLKSVQADKDKQKIKTKQPFNNKSIIHPLKPLVVRQGTPIS